MYFFPGGLNCRDLPILLRSGFVSQPYAAECNQMLWPLPSDNETAMSPVCVSAFLSFFFQAFNSGDRCGKMENEMDPIVVSMHRHE